MEQCWRTDRWTAQAAARAAEAVAQRIAWTQRREVLQVALHAFAPHHPALYADTMTLMQALHNVLAQELAQQEG